MITIPHVFARPFYVPACPVKCICQEDLSYTITNPLKIEIMYAHFHCHVQVMKLPEPINWTITYNQTNYTIEEWNRLLEMKAFL